MTTRTRFRVAAVSLALGLILVALAFRARATAAPQNSGSAAWNALVDDYFDNVFFKFQPTAGTSAGFHQYDTQLEDYSRAGVDAQIAALHAIEKRVEAFGASGLNPTEVADRELVLAQIKSQLLTLETIRPWEKNPDTYSSGISNSVFTIMSRKFAPPDARLASVAARSSSS